MTGITIVVGVVSIWGIKSIQTKGGGDNPVHANMQETFKSFAEQTEIESSNSEPKIEQSITEQNIYIPDMSDNREAFIRAPWLFIKSAEDYVIYEYEFRGDMPQTEIVESENFDYASMRRALCAIEDFCGTDFRIVDTYYVGAGGMVQFEYDDHEYTCITDYTSGHLKICDRVIKSSNGELETEQNIYTSDMSEDYWDLVKSAWLFIESAEDYVICEYHYQEDKPQTTIVVLKNFDGQYPKEEFQTAIIVPKDFDGVSMLRAVCAIEDFCGGTDFRIVDTYYVGSGGNVQFEYDNHEYTCITDGISYDLKICDKVFEHD